MSIDGLNKDMTISYISGKMSHAKFQCANPMKCMWIVYFYKFIVNIKRKLYIFPYNMRNTLFYKSTIPICFS
jgi:hypothetical protein